MNKIVLWVKSYFLYGQLSQEDYERVKTAAAVNNHKSVANLSLISSTIFLILTIISLSSDQAFWAAKFKSYLIGLIISLLAFFTNKFIVSQRIKAQWFPVLLMECGLLTYAMHTTLVSFPEQLSISLIVMFTIVPLLFLQRTIALWILFAIVDIIFSYVAPQVKPAENVAAEISHVICFSIVGLLVGAFFMRSKFERLVFEDKVNQMDNKELLNNNLKYITDIYVSMHHIDLTTGYFFGLRSNAFIDSHLQSNHEDANSQFKYIMEDLVTPEHQKKVLAFVNLNTLPERIKGKRFVSCEFVGKNLGWCRCQFVAQGKVTENSVPTAVIFTVQEVNDEKKLDQ